MMPQLGLGIALLIVLTTHLRHAGPGSCSYAAADEDGLLVCDLAAWLSFLSVGSSLIISVGQVQLCCFRRRRGAPSSEAHARAHLPSNDVTRRVRHVRHACVQGALSLVAGVPARSVEVLSRLALAVAWTVLAVLATIATVEVRGRRARARSPGRASPLPPGQRSMESAHPRLRCTHAVG